MLPSLRPERLSTRSVPSSLLTLSCLEGVGVRAPGTVPSPDRLETIGHTGPEWTWKTGR